MSDIYKITGGKVRLDLHPGQSKAWDSKARFTFIIAGTQSGKTSYGPWHLWNRIKDAPGDYLAVTATYDLFKLKMLPEIQRVFSIVLPDWQYLKAERVYQSPDGKSRVILRSAESEGGLESSTAKGAWLDECGQPGFGLGAWEAIQRRLALNQGWVLGTTTPYNLGWLKTQVYDRWARSDPDYNVVQFRSIENPSFPMAEYERAKATLPNWKFRMFYNAEFARPAGMIYDCWDAARWAIPAFDMPQGWLSVGGLDFGGNNTAAVNVIYPPNKTAFYVTGEYLEGSRTAAEHYQALQSWRAILFVGGSWSEGQWRLEFSRSGMPIKEPPISDVETGIQRVYSAIKEGRLFIARSCVGLLDEIERYSRELDDSGQPTQAIANKKDFHRLDALRYIMAEINGAGWLMS